MRREASEQRNPVVDCLCLKTLQDKTHFLREARFVAEQVWIYQPLKTG